MPRPPFDPEARTYRPRPRVPDAPPSARRFTGPLPVAETLAGKRFVVVGGTGFLGKVLVSLLLKRFPEIEHIYLMVRPREGLTPDERFAQEQWPSPCYDPVREGKNEFEAMFWLQQKLTAIGGDVTKPRGGVDDATLKELKAAGIDAVLNVAGVVSFTPPIDEAFEVNAQGVLNLVDLCKALADVGEGDDPAKAVPLLHTSTCYVAGKRTGVVYEEDPRIVPFPRAEELGREHWDPVRELAEGMSIARAVRARADDPQVQSKIRDEARRSLRERGQPSSGEVLEQAVHKQLRKYLDQQLVKAGAERADHWGWPNAYTYTKAVGEQLLANSGIPFTIVRPAVVESALEFPVPGWNEGINTSAPLVYMALHGQINYPTTPGHCLDVIPVDQVCFGTVLSCAALLRREHEMVYQYGTSDANGFTMNRLIELTGLYKRRFMRQRNRGNPLLNRLYGRIEPVPTSPAGYYRQSTPAVKGLVKAARSGLKMLKGTPAAPVVAPVDKQLAGVEKQLGGAQMVMEAFIPFTAQLDYRFRGDNSRGLARRCPPEDKERVPYSPETLDWRSYWMEVHIKGLRKWVFPHLEARLAKRPRADERFSDLLALLDEVADREGRRIAVQRLVPLPAHERNGKAHDLEGLSYKDLRRAAYACATRLADSGIHPGAKVGLVAKNGPDWAVGLFGILAAGATAVPLDPHLDEEELGRRARKIGVEHALLGPTVEFIDEVACLDLQEFAALPPATEVVEPPEVLVSPEDVAIIPFTAGASGAPKPVKLTHKNLTTVLAAVAPLFKMGRRDSALSVLPLHNSFELTCGLLLPLLRGARVTYVDDVTAEHLTEAFQVAGITAMIGVPQVWEELEQKLADDLAKTGPFAEAAFQAGLLLENTLGRALGLNLGRVLLGPLTERVRGRVRFMMSTGGQVPAKTAETFKALGIEMTQAYGLTEAAPILAMGDGAAGSRPLPGVELEVRDAGDDGVGAIYTRTEGVASGYAADLDDEDAGTAALGPDGWMRTGDLGRIDKKGRITVVAREDEVILLKSGRRVFPRPIEERLVEAEGVIEAAVVGIPDGQGGERVTALLVTEEVLAEDGESESAYLARCRRREDEVRRAAEAQARHLEAWERPEAWDVTFEPLPRTGDHKIRRAEVVAQIVADSTRQRRDVSGEGALEPDEVRAAGEAAVARARRERLAAPGAPGRASTEVPREVRDSVKRVLTEGQMAFYRRGMRVRVSGEHHIPHNRQTIVAANHASHLDMGLIKYALGSYGRDLVTLAAKDYFFEGKWRRAYFENFTNLRPFDRGDSPRESMREASALLEEGKTVLIFPEGTRTATGEISAFRSAVSWLSLKHGVDILPVYVEGTYRSMPRGAVIPKNRKVEVRIGPPIDAARVLAATEAAGLRMSAACAKAAELTQRAVEALRDERTFDLDDALARVLGQKEDVEVKDNPLQSLFDDLSQRFVPQNVDEPLSYYFSLGAGPDSKWTVKFDKSGCTITNEKLDEPANCVMKTDVRMFTRIVKEHYIPQVSEFMDGTVKTNDPELLLKFVSVFNL